MNLFIDVLAIVSFVVSLLPNLLNLIIFTLWIITGCEGKMAVKYGFFAWLALLVWPIAYWFLK
jgi:hypothetical protein